VLSEGVSPDEVFSEEWTFDVEVLDASPPLVSVAAYYRAESCVRYLIGEGCNVNAMDGAHRPVAFFAVVGGSVPIITLLNAHGIMFEDFIADAARYACYEAFIWIFAQRGGRLPPQPNPGLSILHAAARGGDPRILSLTLRVSEIDINARTDSLQTPLHFAVKSGSVDAVKILLEVPGIEVNALDNRV
jgi:hypothetical protein